MTLEPKAIDLATFALDVSQRIDGNAWLVLVADAGDVMALCERVAQSIQAISGQEVTVTAADSSRGVLRMLKPSGAEIRVLGIADAFSDDDWSHLDRARSRLQRVRPTVVILSPTAVAAMTKHAPNLFSWIGGSIWRCERAPALSEQEKLERLSALHGKYGFSNQEVIEKAERRELPSEPDLAEWLLLLGRGDLIEP